MYSNKRKSVNEHVRESMFKSKCKDLKERYYKCLNTGTYRNNTCDVNRVEMVRAREVIIKKLLENRN